MKNFFTRKKPLFVAATAALALSLSACGGSGGGGTASSGTDEAPYKVADNVTLTGSPTYDAIKSSGKVRIGVKQDQPGLGFKDAATGEYTGFDIEIAKWIAASLGMSKDKIEFKPIPSANRESAITNGDIDYYVGTYSITDKRKQLIDFAGPYFVTGQGLLVAADEKDIKGPDDLAGKNVCSATGSTSIQRIKTQYPDAQTTEFDTYSQCVEQLKNGQVDAVTTDESILIGFAAQDPDNLKVVGDVFSEERYGVGLAKGDTAMQEFINKMFTDGGDIWQAIFDKNLGPAGVKGAQPEVDPVS